jgi:hypothetical protein
MVLQRLALHVGLPRPHGDRLVALVQGHSAQGAVVQAEDPQWDPDRANAHRKYGHHRAYILWADMDSMALLFHRRIYLVIQVLP